MREMREKLRSRLSEHGDGDGDGGSVDARSRASTGPSAGIKFQSLMKKLDFESRGIKKKLKRLSHMNERSTLDQILCDIALSPEAEKKNMSIDTQLKAFATRHQSHHRPIALVTSGGTATDLEIRAVLYLDNFSTGQRGAVSVEEFLKRGYAVIHLWRQGSAAPYSRVMNQMLGTRAANHAMNFDALGKLFEGQQLDDEKDDGDGNEGSSSKVKNDPWLTSTSKRPTTPSASTADKSKKKSEHDSGIFGDDDENATDSMKINRMNLTNRILNSTKLQIKLRERSNVIKDGLLLTVPFRTVEEYSIRLKKCTEAMHDCQSLGLIYLAAAMSDFYIPRADKAEHKIQSRDYDIEKIGLKAAPKPGKHDAIYIDKQTSCLHLKLSPVPKVIPLIREDYAPNAFCVSFKLETDKDILVDKAKMAINNYDIHIMIGNVLETRYENSNASKIVVDEVSRTDASLSSTDELEDAMISHVVEKHFEYIANHYLVDDNASGSSSDRDVMPRTALMAGAEAAARYNAYLMEKKRKLQNELYWKRLRDLSLNIAGHALGMYITYCASYALQRRMRIQ